MPYSIASATGAQAAPATLLPGQELGYVVFFGKILKETGQ